MHLLEKNKVFKIIRKKNNTKLELEFVVNQVKKYKGIEYAETIITEKYNDAKMIISNFKEGKYKKSIYSVLDFLIDRKK